MARKVRYEEMLPHEMKREVIRTPIVYVPAGTLEWHGVHMGLGNDAVKAHELCIRSAQRSGGVVVPPTFWAVGGLDQPWTCIIEREGVESLILAPLFRTIFRELERVGFKLVMLVTGHYGQGQVVMVKKAALDYMGMSGATVYAFPEYEVVCDMGHLGDHAAKWETSILWYLRPELVDMKRLPKDPNAALVGIGGEDPRRHASRGLGRRISEAMVRRIGDRAHDLLSYSYAQRAQFIAACRKQLEFLTSFAVLCRSGRMKPDLWKMSRDLYLRRFLNHFRQGEYRPAVRLADQMLRKLPRC